MAVAKSGNSHRLQQNLRPKTEATDFETSKRTITMLSIQLTLSREDKPTFTGL